MLFQSLFELAEDSSLTAEEYMAQAEEFLRVSALEDGETDPNDLVDALECHLRYDILESIKDHPVYGERAKIDTRLISTTTIQSKREIVMCERTYRIPAINFPRLESEIEKLNKRAAKLNTEPVVLTTLETVVEKKRNDVIGFDYEET